LIGELITQRGIGIGNGACRFLISRLIVVAAAFPVRVGDLDRSVRLQFIM